MQRKPMRVTGATVACISLLLAGCAVLELKGSDATLTDGATAAFTGCKTGGSEAPSPVK
jgi:hypothetical protein